MTDQTHTQIQPAPVLRYLLVAGLVFVAFFMSYRLAVASRAPGSGPVPANYVTPAGYDAADPSAGGAGCACCGPSAGSSEPVEGSAVVDADGVQRITVDTANSTYSPNVIKLQAGVPAEITFRQAGGCLGQVMSQPLGFFEDISTGDKTVKLDSLTAGTYDFSCGMQMVFGQIVVE